MECMPARIIAGRDLSTCPIGQGSLPGQGVTGPREWPYVGQGKQYARSEERSFAVTADTLDAEEENLVEADELLVEEVSIDGMCGVY